MEDIRFWNYYWFSNNFFNFDVYEVIFMNVLKCNMEDKIDLLNEKYSHLNFDCLRKRKIKKWSEEEIKYLLNNYLEIDTEKLAKTLNRTKNNIYSKAYQLGLNKTGRNWQSWTEEEINLLTSLYRNTDIQKLLLLINRSKNAINWKANELGLKFRD